MNSIILIITFCLAEGYLNNGLLSISITRHHKGDIFIAQGEKCYKDFCTHLSGGTAVPTGNNECECKCTTNRAVFRDDLNICVDDIQECNLLPFASNSIIKKIPYVFLPLKGQIVYPSADIVLSDIENPVCVVSGGQFLGQNGWFNLRNNSGVESPFRLFQDEERTYLQWFGESSLRMAMEGRIILIHLMCKNAKMTEEPKIFTPCIAFRVAGNPSVKEMMFVTDVHLKEEHGNGLNAREFIAIGVCSLLLVIVYVAAVFFCLHIRKRKCKKGNKKTREDTQLTLGEEGVIKSNPLLQATRNLSIGGQNNAEYISESNSCCSDTDQISDLLCPDEEELVGSQNVQTSAIIHPCDLDYGESAINQDSNNIEKLPEENVSIVETLEAKDDHHSETIKAMGCANGRRKLYFNPSYFEPDLLKAPPPAAMEFLIKIREVIAIAKHKMSAKKFSPSLLGIPEEDGSSRTDYNSVVSAQKSFNAAEKYETEKSPCLDKTPQSNFHLLPNELSWPSDTKQKIIRKWLEDVPVMILHQGESKSPRTQENKILNKSKLWGMSEENITEENIKAPTPTARPDKRKTKGRAPPVPLLKTESNREKKTETSHSFNSTIILENTNFENLAPPQPPPMPPFKHSNDEVPRVQGKDCVPPLIAKNLMDAVIQELTNYKKNDKNSKLQEFPDKVNDILKESKVENFQNYFEKGSSTTQITQKEATTIDCKPTEIKNKMVETPQDDHEYEIILLNEDPSLNKEKDLKIYNLPEILSKNNRTEGYSLVSEVYVNDGYSCCSGESPPSSYSNMSVESDKVYYDTPNDKSGRLTIHVNDSPERYKTSASESDNFEPDTLDRKPRKSKLVKKINEERERYSNQKFQDMECYINSKKSEIFTDSLERSSIKLKTNGTFKQEPLEHNIDNFFKTLNWCKVENFGSLREIYEAKSKNHRKRTETTSMITMDTIHSDHDRLSTLSWSEEKKNKLLHRGIILHINEGESRKHKRPAKRKSQVMNPPEVPSRSLKPYPSPRSRSVSPTVRSTCTSPSSCTPGSSRSMSPPLPPPRSLPSSSPPILVSRSPTFRFACSPPPQIQPRSTSASPVQTDGRKGYVSPSSHSPNNSTPKSFKSPKTPPSCPSPTPAQPIFLSFPSSASPPPRPPKVINSCTVLSPRNTKPPLPPKNSKKSAKPGKFAGRPLPPLPRSTKDYSSSSPISHRDPETLSTFSGASMDSLNSSDYEAFYTLPYQEEELGSSSKEDFIKTPQHTTSNISFISNSFRQIANRESRDGEKKLKRSSNKTLPLRPEDSGYLSTDSDSCCPQFIIPTHFSRIPESGSQNSETEESLCDGASESGGESVATDSFFYGHFKKKSEKISDSGEGSEVYPYSLRLSDVEVNSDTERHCVPIMVRP